MNFKFFFSSLLYYIHTMSTTILPSARSTESKRSGLFHQRRPSLTTICPPPDTRAAEKRRNSTHYITLRNTSYKTIWFTKLFDLPLIQLVGWVYIVICFCLSTIHLVSSFSLLDPNAGKQKKKLNFFIAY